MFLSRGTVEISLNICCLLIAFQLPLLRGLERGNEAAEKDNLIVTEGQESSGYEYREINGKGSLPFPRSKWSYRVAKNDDANMREMEAIWSGDGAYQIHHLGIKHVNSKLDSHYINEWLVHILGGKDVAKRTIEELGYSFGAEVKGFPDVYTASHTSPHHDHRREKRSVTDHIHNHPQVLWAKQQVARIREKRSSKLLLLENWVNKINTKFGKPKDRYKGKKLTKEQKMFNDSLWSHQWYMFENPTKRDGMQIDLRVLPVWESGITGKGVTIVVIDDGLEWSHEDIVDNYDPSLSYDLNDDDPDPTPRYDEGNSNNHGTFCAGEIVMKPNNGKCGAGIAYGASIAGIRLLDGNITDHLEGVALAITVPSADIISCSWGPKDDGLTVDGPLYLAELALRKGIQQGRDGKGIIYVWAAGNGGLHEDNCNCDGYTSSIYTIGVNSASERRKSPWYAESCSSTMTSTYSSGGINELKIITTKIHNQCSDDFSGTSAATPLAAAIIALALEANPNMTWRDVQHAVVRASNWKLLEREKGWRTNGAGLHFNSKFGYGLLTAEPLVKLAQNWSHVSDKRICVTNVTIKNGQSNLKSGLSRMFDINPACELPNMIERLEHVELVVTMIHTRRGAVGINLTSPSETSTTLLSSRPNDVNMGVFDEWSFMSVQLWGEDPTGAWKAEISDTSVANETGTIFYLTLILHGT